MKLYGIFSNPKIKEAEVKSAIEKTVNSWKQSINNDSFNSEQAKKYLNESSKYEAILCNSSYRKELYKYYNSDKTISKKINFASRFFSVVSASKKITKRDVEFYFECFEEEKVNQKEIIKYLKDKYHVNIHIKSNNKEEVATEAASSKNNLFIVNLFDEKTIVNLQNCNHLFKTFSYDIPQIKKCGSLANFLKLENFHSSAEAEKVFRAKAKEYYNMSLDSGAKYEDASKLYRCAADLLSRKASRDNYNSLKILVKYPELAPCMYLITIVKKSTLSEFAEFAFSLYNFKNEKEFLSEYFVPLYENFGINVSSIKKLLKGYRTKKTKVYTEKTCKNHYSVSRKTICNFALAVGYWPVFLSYSIFKFIKLILINFQKILTPIAVGVGFWLSETLLGFVGFPNISSLKMLVIDSKQWITTYEKIMNCENITEPKTIVAYSIAILLLSVFVCATILAVFIVWVKYMDEGINKKFDVVGVDRTYKYLFKCLKEKTNVLYYENHKKLILNIIGCFVFNVLIVVSLGAYLYFSSVR